MSSPSPRRCSRRGVRWCCLPDDVGNDGAKYGADRRQPIDACTFGAAVPSCHSDPPARNVTNPITGATPTYVIPTENEWYKAAYYSPVLNSGSGGYYAYATQSNTAPGNVIGNGANQANYNNGVYSVTQSASISLIQNYLTDVGAFTNSASFYGTFDQSGNVYQWNDLDGTAGSSRGVRGGGWVNDAFVSSSSFTDASGPAGEVSYIGFRLVAVPEPSTWVMGLAGIACGGWHISRRRKQA